MLKKRLLGVVTVKQGLAVQSMGYRRWLPLGRPEVLVENLDRWGADEILVQCIDRSAGHLGPDLGLLDRIARLSLSTPLVYGGGIRHAVDAAAVVQRAADRVVVDALLRDNPSQVREISQRLGAQALVACLPLSLRSDRTLLWRCYRNLRSTPLPDSVLKLLSDRVVSEALVVDWQHEGRPGAFDICLAQVFNRLGLPFIAFGGISEAPQLRAVLSQPCCVAVGMGNFLAWREHALQSAKRALAELEFSMDATNTSLRPPLWQGLGLSCAGASGGKHV